MPRERAQFKIANGNVFFIRRYDAFLSLRILGEVQKKFLVAFTSLMEARDEAAGQEAQERNLFKAIDNVSKSLDGDSMVALVKLVLNPEFVSVKVPNEDPEKLDEGMLNRTTDSLFDVVSLVVAVLKENYTELFTQGKTLIGKASSSTEESLGVLREDFESELLIWRPIMEGFVTLTEVKDGVADIADILKMNALLDLKAALEQREIDRSQG